MAREKKRCNSDYLSDSMQHFTNAVHSDKSKQNQPEKSQYDQYNELDGSHLHHYHDDDDLEKLQVETLKCLQ